MLIYYRFTAKSKLYNTNCKVVYGDNVKLYESCLEVPLVEIMQNLGVDFEWEDMYTAKVFLDDKKYVLDLSKETLTEEGESFNYLSVPPGSKHYSCKTADKELFLDYSTFMVVVRKLGYKVFVDYNENEIDIVVT